jgi:hypothetical protein
VYYIKFAPRCPSLHGEATRSLAAEAKNYLDMTAPVRALFVKVLGYYSGKEDGDYLVTVSPRSPGVTFYHAHMLPDSVDRKQILGAMVTTLNKMFANGYTHEDLHAGNFLVGVSDDSPEFTIVLLDPGCFDSRASRNPSSPLIGSPYEQHCDQFLYDNYRRSRSSFSEATWNTLKRMLDVLCAICDLLTEGLQRPSTYQEAARECIEANFGWKVNVDLVSWSRCWDKELSKCVSIYVHTVLEPAPPAAGSAR